LNIVFNLLIFVIFAQIYKIKCLAYLKIFFACGNIEQFTVLPLLLHHKSYVTDQSYEMRFDNLNRRWFESHCTSSSQMAFLDPKIESNKKFQFLAL